MTQSPEEKLRSELEKVAPGTALRQGLDFILSASNGALVVLGDVERVPEVCSGGIEINTPFTPHNLYELAKMDGAIILDEECGRILRANVHLVPDAELPTIETGMRHRAAESLLW